MRLGAQGLQLMHCDVVVVAALLMLWLLSSLLLLLLSALLLLLLCFCVVVVVVDVIATTRYAGCEHEWLMQTMFLLAGWATTISMFLHTLKCVRAFFYSRVMCIYGV